MNTEQKKKEFIDLVKTMIIESDMPSEKAFVLAGKMIEKFNSVIQEEKVERKRRRVLNGFKKWDEAQDEHLKQVYGTKKVRLIAKELNRTTTAVSQRAMFLGLTKPKPTAEQKWGL